MTATPEFQIGDRWVGGDHEVYVIAEAGANHNRDKGVARELIEVAAAAGADAVKFQTYSGARLYSSKTPQFEYLKGVTDRSPSDYLEDISLPREWQGELAEHARGLGLHFFSTPFDHDAVAELAALNVPVFKVASFEIVDLPLIRRIGEEGLPVLLSTGMAVMGEIEEALQTAREAGAPAVGLMQCTSLYPAPPEQANLAAMETMRRAFGVPVGLSDHTLGTAVPIAAAALGAAFIEKHFTLDRSMPGPDHPHALEPDELNEMVEGVRTARAALGDGIKHGPSAEESAEMYTLARRSLIVTRPLPAGTVLEANMLTVKRPGFGIPPKYMELVIGRALTREADADDILTWDMI
jgi:sialic acid synthase SpsE